MKHARSKGYGEKENVDMVGEGYLIPPIPFIPAKHYGYGGVGFTTPPSSLLERYRLGCMEYKELTSTILSACFEVSNELGCGFLESVYEKALVLVLREKGLRVESQVPLQVKFRGCIVGEFYPDIVVEDNVLLELKAVKKIAPEHIAQVLNYLKATEKPVGMLVNFGNAKVEYRRFNNRFEVIKQMQQG